MKQAQNGDTVRMRLRLNFYLNLPTPSLSEGQNPVKFSKITIQHGFHAEN